MISKLERETAMRSLFLSHMPVEVADSILADASSMEVAGGESIFRQGEPARAVYIVVEGLLKLSRTTRSGSETVVGVFEPGDSVAEALALSEHSFPANGTALVNSRLLMIGNNAIQKNLFESKEVFASVLAATYAQLHRLVEQVEQLKAYTSVERVGRFILRLAEPTDVSTSVHLPYDKTVIAGLLGITPETLSRSFQQLRKHGVVVSGQTVSISDVALLQRFVEKD